jgi:hypothetical protein
MSMAKVSANKARVFFMSTCVGSTSYADGKAGASRTWASIIAAADGYDRWRVRKISNGNMAEVPPLVVAEYYGAATVGANTIIDYATRVEDTHNAVTTGAGAWRFTAPVSGLYLVNASVRKDSNAGSLFIFKGGSSSKFLGYLPPSSNGGGSACIRLNSGDYIDIRASGSILTDTTSNARVQIARIGG